MKRTHIHLTPAIESGVSAIMAATGQGRAEVIRALLIEALAARARSR